MTSPLESPGVEPTQAEGTGGAGGMSSEAPEAAGTPESGEEPGTLPKAESGDYLERIRNEPEFAVDQIRTKDQVVTKANQELKRYKQSYQALDPVINNLGGGEAVLGMLTRLNNILVNPGMKRIVERFEQTGSLPTVGEGYGGYEEPEEEDPRDIKLRELEQRQQELNRKLGRQEQMGNIERLKKEFPEDWDELGPMMLEELDQWERDPSKRNLLAGLTYDGLRTVALTKLYGDPEERDRRMARAYQRKLEGRKQKATDVPSGVATTGQETVVKKGPVTANDALREFLNKEGLSRLEVPRNF